MKKHHEFEFKGKSSLDFGLIIHKKNVFAAPASDVTIIDIPGRSGHLIEDNYKYPNIDIKYSCTIIPEKRFEDMSELSRSIKSWLLPGVGYFKLADTYNKYYFRMASYHSALDIEDFLIQLGRVTITFDCKPFMYSSSGQIPVVFTTPGILVNSESFETKPYIKIIGTGEITLKINNDSFLFRGIEEFIEIDSELMNAFKGITLQNKKMYSTKFPTLYPGTNNITWIGSVSKVEIIPRWCTL